jgi:hypothetical protein
MKLIAFLSGIVSLLLMLVAFIPMLGWLNWLFIPFAFIGYIISSSCKSSSGKAMNGMAMIFGLLRLFLGGGIL